MTRPRRCEVERISVPQEMSTTGVIIAERTVSDGEKVSTLFSYPFGSSF
jgi:hypothetical protein